jgi:hypothetical protein
VKSLVIAKRFCGPSTSANGGYFAGRVAALAPRPSLEAGTALYGSDGELRGRAWALWVEREWQREPRVDQGKVR